MSKVKTKVLGMQYGIEITRPWSNKMYEHNDMVADLMKQNIRQSLDEIYSEGDSSKLRDLCKHICSYGMGPMYSIDEVYEEAIRELEMTQNYWLDCEWPFMVKAGLVKDIEHRFVGYDKNI